MSTRQEASSTSNGFLNPLGSADCIALAYQGSDISRVFHGIADSELLYAFEECIGEFAVHRLFHQNALYRNASLTGIPEPPRNTAYRGRHDIGIVVHEDPRVAAEFEYNLLLAGILFDQPADSRASREADEFYAVVRNQDRGVLVRERQDIEATIGPTCFLNRFGQQNRT